LGSWLIVVFAVPVDGEGVKQVVWRLLHCGGFPAGAVAVAGQGSEGSGFGQYGQVVAVEVCAACEVVYVAEGGLQAGLGDAVGALLAHSFDHA
jgi:hypothetical protein